MASRGRRLAFLFGFAFALPVAYSLENGLGRTPPMGWNSWNHYRCHVSESLIRKVADAFLSKGLSEAG